jgi:hypothetical protein
VYPFLLELYSDYELHLLTVDERLDVVRMIESYVFRRAMCAIPTNSLNKTFSTFRQVGLQGSVRREHQGPLRAVAVVPSLSQR